jgi:hypothetical protein
MTHVLCEWVCHRITHVVERGRHSSFRSANGALTYQPRLKAWVHPFPHISRAETPGHHMTFDIGFLALQVYLAPLVLHGYEHGGPDVLALS